MGDGNPWTSNIASLALPIAAGVASAYSQPAARGTQALGNMLSLQSALKGRKQDDALRAAQLENIEYGRQDREARSKAIGSLGDILLSQAGSQNFDEFGVKPGGSMDDYNRKLMIRNLLQVDPSLAVRELTRTPLPSASDLTSMGGTLPPGVTLGSKTREGYDVKVAGQEPEKKKRNLRVINTVNEAGQPVKKIVDIQEGDEYPTPPSSTGTDPKQKRFETAVKNYNSIRKDMGASVFMAASPQEQNILLQVAQKDAQGGDPRLALVAREVLAAFDERFGQATGANTSSTLTVDEQGIADGFF
jgi:hypothetical protein